MNKILGWVLIIVICLISGLVTINSLLTIIFFNEDSPLFRIGQLTGTILVIYLIFLLIKYLYKKVK